MIASIVFVNLGESRKKAKIAKSMQFSQSVSHVLGAYTVGVWSFDDDVADGNFSDISGYGNDCIINNATEEPNGIIGKAVNFDGNNAYLNCNNKFLALTDNFTISFWLNIPGFQNYGNTDHVLVVKGEDYNGDYGFWIDTPSDMQICFGRQVDTDCPCWITNSYNSWHYLVGTKGNGKFKLYVDGDLHQETDDKVIPTSDENVFIGGSTFANRCSTVIIDEVRIYDEALIAGEIQKHYVEGLERHKNLALGE